MFIRDHNKTALIFEDRAYSYSEIISGINDYASAYTINHNDRVVVMSENRPQWIYAFYSVWTKGGITVPVDYGIDYDDLVYLLSDCSPAVIFCSINEKDLVTSVLSEIDSRAKVLVFEEIKIGEHKNTSPSFDIKNSLDDTAMIMYTSGTTGPAKGVMLTYNNLSASIESLMKLDMLTKNDVLLGLLPLHHIFPLQGELLAPFYTGATVVFIKNMIADEIRSALSRHRVTMFLGVPRLYDMFHAGIMCKIQASRIALLLLGIARLFKSRRLGRLLFGKVHRAFSTTVHSYLTGGAKLSDKVSGDMWALGFRLIEGYGATETAPLIAFNPFKKIKLGSVGLPMEGSQVEIFDDEIIVKGPNVMKGYYNKPEETAWVLRDGWFHTGDTGFFDKNGYLYISGRKDEMIVLPNGHNINPEEIEAKILSMTGLIKDICVIQEQGVLTAVVVPDLPLFRREGIVNIMEAVKQRIIELYNSSVSAHKRVLKVIITRDELPRTRLGKLRRFMVREMLTEPAEKKKPALPPEYKEYQLLSDHIFNQKKIRPAADDHLAIDLGMDSLDMVELISFAEHTFGINLASDDLLQNSTFGELAEYIKMTSTELKEGDLNWNKILSRETGASLKDTPLNIPILRWIGRNILFTYFTVTVEGIENIPGHQCIFALNHQSFIDMPLLGTLLPKTVIRNTYFLVKDAPVMSRLVAIALSGRNMIKINIDKDLKGALQSTARVLNKGKNLIIFPEGLRTRDGRLLPFKKTFAILSKELNVPVVPIGLRGTYKLFPYKKKFPRRGKVEFKICNEMKPGNEESYADFTGRVQDVIKSFVDSEK